MTCVTWETIFDLLASESVGLHRNIGFLRIKFDLLGPIQRKKPHPVDPEFCKCKLPSKLHFFQWNVLASFRI